MIIYLNGYFRNWDYVDKHTSRLRNRDIVEYRIKVLKFWDKHGLEAALEYAKDLNPHGKCSRASMYRWKKNLIRSGERDRMGRCKYILNAIDYVSERATSIILPSNKSCYTAEVLKMIDKQFGFKIKRIQTDNGSEFMDKFANMMETLNKTHFYNYVKKPMWNGKVERFNRTMQEEWLADPDIQVLIANDRNEANLELQKYINWYNNERPHQSINYMTPNEYVLYFNTRGDLKKSQMS